MTHDASLTIASPGDREVAITRGFSAPRGLVFDCYTKPELVQRWLLGPPGYTMPVCEIDFRVGGAIRYEWQSPDGTRMGMSGAFREIAPTTRLVHTELFDQDWTGGETLVTTGFVGGDGRTTVTTTVRYASREARDGALKSGMEQGLAASYDRLDAYLSANPVA